jgi:hypothetical protein
MRRTLVEIAAFVGASLLMALGALAVASNMTVAPAPPPAYVSQRAGCHDAPVFAMAGASVTGHARLCILDEGVRPAADVQGLTPGTAYVTWFAYFHRPELCQKPRCALEDLQEETSEGVSGRLDGTVAESFRTAQFHGDFRDLRLVGGSEAQIFIFERGTMTGGDSRARVQKLLTLQVPGIDIPETHPGAGGGRLVARAIFDLP